MARYTSLLTFGLLLLLDVVVLQQLLWLRCGRASASDITTKHFSKKCIGIIIIGRGASRPNDIGTIGRMVAPDATGLQFESSRQTAIFKEHLCALGRIDYNTIHKRGRNWPIT